MSAMAALRAWSVARSDEPAQPDWAARQVRPAPRPGRTLESAIEMLQKRGFAFIGSDRNGLPCYRSPSGALLISIGSCRTLAYAPVGGRFEVIATAHTAALVSRITLSGGAIP
jgi:hypothetical protein